MELVILGVIAGILALLLWKKQVTLKTFLVALGAAVAYAALVGKREAVKKKVTRKLKITNPLQADTKKKLLQLETKIQNDEFVERYYARKMAEDVANKKAQLKKLSTEELYDAYMDTIPGN